MIISFRFQNEYEEWIKTAKILTAKFMNESLESLFPVTVDPEKKVSKQEPEYVDQEKIVKPEEAEAKPVSVFVLSFSTYDKSVADDYENSLPFPSYDNSAADDDNNVVKGKNYVFKKLSAAEASESI